MKKLSSWLWGCVLVIIGVILGVNALGLAHIDIFFPGWWTLLIIVPCAIGVLTDSHKGGQFVGLAIGICLLLSCWGVLPFGMLWKLLVPALFVLIGIGIILHATSQGEVQDKIRSARKAQAAERKKQKHIAEAEIVEEPKKKNSHTDDNDEDDDDDKDVHFQEYWSTFGDQEVDYDEKEFKGCKLDAVFGGVDLDLRKAKIKDEAIVRASSVFGGIIIYVPEDVKVEIASSAVFGSATDKRKDTKKAKEDKKSASTGKTLYIDATCVFGSVEIR